MNRIIEALRGKKNGEGVAPPVDETGGQGGNSENNDHPHDHPHENDEVDNTEKDATEENEQVEGGEDDHEETAGENDGTPDTTPGVDNDGAPSVEALQALQAENATLAHRLHAALVAADGRLSDPAALAFDPDHLQEGDNLTDAITQLVERHPALKAQQVAGDVGAGPRGDSKAVPFDLIDIMRGG